MRQLGKFFRPESIAVIGASRNPDKIGHVILKNLVDAGFQGGVFPVNPNAADIIGIKCYRSVVEIPESVDVAVISVPSAFVLGVMKDCARKRIKNIVMVTAGFSEVGNRKLEQKVLDITKKNNMNLIGPNCLGILDLHSKVDTLFLPISRLNRPRAGHIAFVSQSGAVGSAALDFLSGGNIGFSKFVSYGNAVDVNETDLLEFLESDENTKVICMYIEGVKSRRFFDVAKRVSKVKPVVVLKGGITEAGARATISHTASLAGAYEVYSGIFRQCGIIKANNLEELFYFAYVLEKYTAPMGNRVQVITNGGGFGILTADSVANAGLVAAQMSKNTHNHLRKLFPEEYVIGNPIDLTGGCTAEDFEAAISACTVDKNIDVILVDLLFQTPMLGLDVVEKVKELSRLGKPLFVVSMGSRFSENLKSKLEEQGIVCFSHPHQAAAAIKALCDYYLM